MKILVAQNPEFPQTYASLFSTWAKSLSLVAREAARLTASEDAVSPHGSTMNCPFMPPCPSPQRTQHLNV
jgi:hypothetical protein